MKLFIAILLIHHMHGDLEVYILAVLLWLLSFMVKLLMAEDASK